MQLINPAIYEKEMQARTQAIEETRRSKTRKRDEREKGKVLRHLQKLDGQESATLSDLNIAYRIFVEGMPFRVAKGGSKLIRESGTIGKNGTLRLERLTTKVDDPKATPKKAEVGGVVFLRSKNGNLHRLGAVKARR